MAPPVSSPPPPPPPPPPLPPLPPAAPVPSLFPSFFASYSSMSWTTMLIASLSIVLVILVVYIARQIIVQRLDNSRSQPNLGSRRSDREPTVTRVLERERAQPLNLRHVQMKLAVFDPRLRDGGDVEGSADADADADDALECAICLRDFERGAVCGVLVRCQHVFHVTCIMPWLRLNSTCPTCRTDAFTH